MAFRGPALKSMLKVVALLAKLVELEEDLDFAVGLALPFAPEGETVFFAVGDIEEEFKAEANCEENEALGELLAFEGVVGQGELIAGKKTGSPSPPLDWLASKLAKNANDVLELVLVTVGVVVFGELDAFGASRGVRSEVGARESAFGFGPLPTKEPAVSMLNTPAKTSSEFVSGVVDSDFFSGAQARKPEPSETSFASVVVDSGIVSGKSRGVEVGSGSDGSRTLPNGKIGKLSPSSINREKGFGIIEGKMSA